MRRRLVKAIAFLLLAVLLVLLGGGLALWLGRPAWTAEEVEEVVIATLVSEEADQFLVTGRFRFRMFRRVSEERFVELFPALSFGTTEVEVRVPAVATYGIDLAELSGEDIDVAPDGLVTVRVPDVQTDVVDLRLDQLEMRTRAGWARTYRGSGQRVARTALRSLRGDVDGRARALLQRRPETARENTIAALEGLIRPVVEAAGVEAPRFRFVFGADAVFEPDVVLESDAAK